jgi:hypothetical protein
MSRLETKFRLMRELGALLDPIERLLFNDADQNPSRVKIAVVLAQYTKDKDVWIAKVHEFCHINDMLLSTFYSSVQQQCQFIQNILTDRTIAFETVKQSFLELQAKVESALREVPADDPDIMLPPQSPFQPYLRLLAICGVTTTRLHLFDHYLDAEVFDRYLPDVGKGVEITLVTDAGMMRKYPRRRGRIIAISELVALERPAQYRLLEVPRLHDRKIRSDDKIFDLGGSLQDASKTDFYSITNTDNNATLHATLDGIIAASAPWYQPGFPKHRKWCSTCKQPTDVNKSGDCAICGNPI